MFFTNEKLKELSQIYNKIGVNEEDYKFLLSKIDNKNLFLAFQFQVDPHVDLGNIIKFNELQIFNAPRAKITEFFSIDAAGKEIVINK